MYFQCLMLKVNIIKLNFHMKTFNKKIPRHMHKKCEIVMVFLFKRLRKESLNSEFFSKKSL